jgi:4-nitrophenyl phosphatase
VTGPVNSLAAVRGLLIDLDGVVYEGPRVIPGAREFFDFLRHVDFPFLLTTNNSTLTPRSYVDRLAGMGIAVAEHQVLGSAEATAGMLAAEFPRGGRAFVIGEDGLLSALEAAGFVLAHGGVDAEDAVDVVVVGLDRQITYEKLTRAVNLVRGGARYVGPNPDTTLPMPFGVIPGAGSFQALITAATGVRPTIVGKPEPTMLLMGAARLGLDPANVAIIGDRLDTDILGGTRAGLVSVLVLTGVTRRTDLERGPAQPDAIFDDLFAVRRALSRG